MLNEFIWVPFVAAITVTFRFMDLNPHRSGRSRFAYLLGPAISWFAIGLVAIQEFQAGIGMGLMMLTMSGILYLFYNRRHS